MINFRGLSLFKEKVDSLPFKEAFEKVAFLFMNAEYVMGKENLAQCDCSGLICSTLTLMDYKIRINANDIATTLNASLHDYTTSEMNDKPELITFSKGGKVKHIGIVIVVQGDEYVLHSSYPEGVKVEELTTVDTRYSLRGYTNKRMWLDERKCKASIGRVYGLDEEMV